MKLEIKHLAPYLPYVITCTANDKSFEDHPLMGLIEYNDTALFDFENGEQDYSLKDFKPLLLPLSKLDFSLSTPFTPYTQSLMDADGGIEENIMSCPYEDMLLMLERHYDVFGLIPAGLAIDKTTI